MTVVRDSFDVLSKRQHIPQHLLDASFVGSRYEARIRDEKVLHEVSNPFEDEPWNMWMSLCLCKEEIKDVLPLYVR